MYSDRSLQELFSKLTKISVASSNGGDPQQTIWFKLNGRSYQGKCAQRVPKGDCLALLTDDGNYWLVRIGAIAPSQSEIRVLQLKRVRPNRRKTTTILGLGMLVSKLNFINTGTEIFNGYKFTFDNFVDKYYPGVDCIFEIVPSISYSDGDDEVLHYDFYDDTGAEIFYPNSSNRSDFHNYLPYDTGAIAVPVIPGFKAENFIFNRITYQSMGYVEDELNIFVVRTLTTLQIPIDNGVIYYRVRASANSDETPTQETYNLVTSELNFFLSTGERVNSYFLNYQSGTVIKYRDNLGAIKYCGVYYLRYMRTSSDIDISIDVIKDELVWCCLWGLGDITEAGDRSSCSCQIKGSFGTSEGYSRNQLITVARIYGTDGGVVVIIKLNNGPLSLSPPADYIVDRNDDVKAFFVPQSYIERTDEVRFHWRDMGAIALSDLPDPVDTREVIYNKIIDRGSEAGSTYLTYYSNPEEDAGKVVFD